MNSKEVIQKRNKIFTSFIVTILVIISAMIIVALTVKDYNNMTLINIILVIVLMIVSITYKNVLFGYNNMAKIARVVLTQAKPIPYKRNLMEFPSTLLKQGFQMHAKTYAYDIYYKIDIDQSLKVKSIKMMYLVLLLKDSTLDFYDKNLHDDIEKLESTFTRKTMPSKYIITAFKSYESIEKKDFTELSEVVSYQNKKHSYSQINVGLNQDDHKAYFLYSDSYNPTQYYKKGVDFIKKIIK
jgi:hypothetical protein